MRMTQFSPENQTPNHKPSTLFEEQLQAEKMLMKLYKQELMSH